MDTNPLPGSVPPSAPKEPSSQQRVAPPPKEDITLRTMNSDVKSIGRGDSIPVPENVLPPEAANEPVFKPETQNQLPNSPLVKKQSKKTLLFVVVGIIVIIGLGAGGYFLYPVLFPPTPIAQTPPPPPLPPATPALAHQTSFVAQPKSTVELTLKKDQVQSITITELLHQLSTQPQQPQLLQEISIKNSDGGQIPWAEYFTALNTAFTPDQLDSWFDQDFTAFLYYDAKGVWPGYVLKIKAGIKPEELKTNFAPFEKSDLNKLFLTPPGTLAAFKDGQVKSRASRYTTGAASGSALSYTVLDGRYVLISASYAGAQEAATLLGF